LEGDRFFGLLEHNGFGHLNKFFLLLIKFELGLHFLGIEAAVDYILSGRAQ
jgi:hypothetical protein